MTVVEIMDISKSIASSYIVGLGISLSQKDLFDEYLAIFEASIKELDPKFKQVDKFIISQEIIMDLAKSMSSTYLTCVVPKLQLNKDLAIQEYFSMFNYAKKELALRNSKLVDTTNEYLSSQVEEYDSSGKSLN